jgi:hypothetical protein
MLAAVGRKPEFLCLGHQLSAMDDRPWTVDSLLIIAPLVHPFGLDLFQVTFVGFFPFAFKVIQSQDPLDQIGKPDPVDLGFVKFIAKFLVQCHSDIFVVPPVHRRLKTVSHILYLFFPDLKPFKPMGDVL